MDLNEYIKLNYNSNPLWFIEEVQQFHHQKRILDVIKRKKYLNGKHAIMDRVVENYNGKPYQPNKILLQYGKLILNLEQTYLLGNRLTITGSEDVAKEMKRVYKKGQYDDTDFKLLGNVIKFGDAYEILFVDSKSKAIKSKVIENENAYPVYDDEGELVSFIEHYVAGEEANEYFILFSETEVQKYSTIGTGKLSLISKNKNVGGLPIHYKNVNEINSLYGKSDLDDFVGIVDQLEDILSKFSDSFYKHHNPLTVISGQELTSGGLNRHIVGNAIHLDDDSTIELKSVNLNEKAFETIFNTLVQQMLNLSSTPSVSLNSTDVSNLSETSMKILYQLSNQKGKQNERYMRNGFEIRFEKIFELLNRKGIEFTEDDIDSLDVVFSYATPQNETEIIDNLVSLKGIGAISNETAIEINPYISNTNQELERLNVSKVVEDKTVEE
ncbi:phage portal protein [Carnobacterium viridans]|uniref:Phage portal protein, SPP1 family n=1 Tax=Carnobacterium viridans TaxID=174587 RepID=A0A1H1AQQ7_9LACT|nr:phage portal protein [Carnobacterium viridans]UDE96091.1 phage portal protein [Carnobacterium viridans]SDQ41999.1 phage portal protein, SPP1 family [Carnobacterium viridans]